MDELSASLDIIQTPLLLQRPHSLMNKFRMPQCPHYQKVSKAIQRAVSDILKGTILQQADKLIREENYALKHLEIRRLSGQLLSMSQCYINLAIIEARKQEGKDRGSTSVKKKPGSEFSIANRLRVQAPNKTLQISLPALFSEQNGSWSRRILIRGRAGVGKTTLCKKIIYEFYHRETELRRSWGKLFDRILWFPLRSLKQREILSNTDLFLYAFFQRPEERRDLAAHLSHLLPSIKSRTLFLLDGLDEISSDFPHGSSAYRFMEQLLGQDNVIITSRPSANLPHGAACLDLDLEVIGFYPNQVKEYIYHVFTDLKDGKRDTEATKGVLSLIDRHWLIQSLVRIPIQLDAICFTWSDWVRASTEPVPETMTSIYELIEERLWKKDIEKLEITNKSGQLLNPDDITASIVKNFVPCEVQFLECLAFSGLHDDKIEFASGYRNQILHHLQQTNFSPEETSSFWPDRYLRRTSFMRPLNLQLTPEHQKYHFIHLTFQEYFAANYFAKIWHHPSKHLYFPPASTGCNPSTARDYLRKHKYTPRYDVFWRFVAGLLGGLGSTEFLSIVEQEPLDLLGPTHQRLLIHCLSEMSSCLPIQANFEQKLKEWVIYEIESSR